MRKEYQVLKDVNAITISESALNTTDIMQELKLQQENLLYSAEQRFKTGLTEVMNSAILDIEKKDKNDTDTNKEMMNNAAEITNLKNELKRLQSQLQTSKSTPRNNSTQNNNYGQYNGRFKSNSRNTRYQPRMFQKQYYCWTHGAGHSGLSCL